MIGAGDFDPPVEVSVSVDSEDVSVNPAGPIEDRLADPETAAWLGLSYSTLSALMVHAQYVAAVHQQHHWTCRGDSFYGDHKLFETLYEATNEHVDKLAEKLIGLSSEKNVDLSIRTKVLSMLVDERYGMSPTIPSASSLAQKSYETEETFLIAIAAAMDALEEQGELTVGLENMLADLADEHEQHKYHLKQRAGL